MPVEIPKDKWTGKVRTVTLGATAAEGGTRARSITVGGDTSMPFMHFETRTPNTPVIALEIKSRKPEDWSSLLEEVWGEAMQTPAAWAKAAESAGADLIVLWLSLEDSADDAVKAVKSVLAATGLPLVVFGPGQVDKDNELLVAVSEAGKGEKLVLGICEDKNYRTIAATSMANGHLIVARTAMDVNLAKQLNILISDMGLPLDRVIMDPTTGALGYGMEYGYSVMERLRLAALQGDAMTQLPMMVTPGFETWKTKEVKTAEQDDPKLGNAKNRGILLESMSAMCLLLAGADVLIMRHPDSIKLIKQVIEELSVPTKS